ncbi:MAG TPA: NUDIX domain-containing protein [Cytophagaceae bacterium]|nr:NUDIX domain-containing protein [Cytophagaceae bacterium]
MNKTHTYSYARPALTVDCVVFGYEEEALKVLLIQRNIEPFKGGWALPGGFVRVEETLEEAAIRELKEETAVENIYLEQLYSFGALQRDPRERVVTVAYYALVKLSEHKAQGGTDAADARWFPLEALPKLAFDHKQIIEVAFKRLQAKVRYEPVGFELLPKRFLFSAIEHLYETILQRKIDRRNFRKKMLSMGIIKQLEEQEENVAHRKGHYYSFDKKEYEKMIKKGFSFEI